MRPYLPALVFIYCCLHFSCNRYKAYESNYQFKSKTGQPDYSSLDYWAAHPWKWDPSDSTPKPLISELKDSTVDVFFLHPTTFTTKRKSKKLNATIDDTKINAKTDYSTILYQASVFNRDCRIFAPRYRQAHIGNFYTADTIWSKQAFETAYADIRSAFEYYLSNYNKGRPFIIAAHSQGSKLGERLLKEFVDGKNLQQQLIVAYLPGWPIPKDFFASLQMCNDSIQTGCLCSWRTFRKGYYPSYFRKENEEAPATNPLNWVITEEYAARQLNKGSVLRRFNKVYKHTTDAQVSKGILFVQKPKFPWSFLFLKRNYHVGDINLFYINIRENTSRRIASYWKN